MQHGLETVDPLKIRMIGAIFWAVLLVVFVPLWFMHPVEFSPNAPKEFTPPLAADHSTAALTAATESSNSAAQVAAAPLFIDKPLTVTPPPADPARVQALHQSISAREAQVDPQGRLKMSSHAAKILEPAPESNPLGKFHVQVASYRSEPIALELQKRLVAAGFPCNLSVVTSNKGKKTYKLRVGPYKSLADAKKAKSIVDARFNAKSIVLGK